MAPRPTSARIAWRASSQLFLAPTRQAPVLCVPTTPSRSRAVATSPGASATRATLGRTGKNALRVPRASSKMLTAARPQRRRTAGTALRASFHRRSLPIPRAPVSPVPIIPSRSRALITSPGASATRATLGRTGKNALRVPRASSRMLTAAQPQRLRPLPPLLAQETVHVSPPLGCRQGRFRTESVITAIMRIALGSSRRRL